MDFGEPICVAPPSTTPPDKEFAAELVSVTFKSGVKASHGQAEIVPPHWEVGKEKEITDDWKDMAQKLGLPTEPYSKRAAVYLIKNAAGAKYDVEVKVKVTKSVNVTGNGKLLGNINGLVIEGTCPTSAGEHTIAAKITEPPETIQSYRGTISWGLDVESVPTCQSLGSTLAEIYFVLAEPSATPYKNGVWSEVLRFLCGKVGVIGEKEVDAVAAKVTTYCHSSHKLRYDTDRGASKYGVSQFGGEFNLSKYMVRKEPKCNCYDQAGAVQTFSLALGAAVGWRFLKPFGFIKPTNLVGVGQCNNPFFKDDDTKKIVDEDSPDRTAFGNHAFANVPGGNILDGCAGPHAGSENPDQYVSASIDDKPSLYAPYAGQFRAGKASDIIPGTGVSGVI
jgi:hypothetical protein